MIVQWYLHMDNTERHLVAKSKSKSCLPKLFRIFRQLIYHTLGFFKHEALHWYISLQMPWMRKILA